MPGLCRVLGLAGSLGLPGCSEPADARAPTRPVGRPCNVLVITLDTTRADHLGCYGHPRVRTPRLDALAADGVRFDQAFTPIPSTFPSHCSLFTGLYPASTGVHDNAVYFLAPEHETLAEILRAQGYATGAFVSAFVLDAQFGLDQGFEVYDDEVDRPLMEHDVADLPSDLDAAQRKWEVTIATAYQRGGDLTVRAAVEWLGGLGDRPFFLWAHTFDAHQPYQPPPPWDREYDPKYRGPMDGDQRKYWSALERGRATRADLDHMAALYGGEVSWQDEVIGRLLDAVRAARRWDETLVIVTADHGEGFGEHGQLFEHNSEIYDEAVRVPLIVRRPDASARGEQVAALARTIDVMPTILDWLGLPADPGIQGISLLPFTDADPARRAAAQGPEWVLLEALRERQINAAKESFLGLRTAAFKTLLALDPAGEVRRVELFDVASDPGEKRDLASRDPGRVDRLRQQALFEHRALPRPAADSARELDALDSAALRALGYAGK